MNLDLSAIYQQLIDFARLDAFWQTFDIIYGTQYDFALAESLQQQWANGDFSQLPQVDLLEGQDLGSAVASYDPTTNTISLSEAFWGTASPAQVNDVLLSEIGFFVAQRVKATNAPAQGKNLGDFITPLSEVSGSGEFSVLEFSALNTPALDQQDIQALRSGLTNLLFNLNTNVTSKLGNNGLFSQLSGALLTNLSQNPGFSLLQTLSTDISQLFGSDTTLTPEQIAERITQKLVDRGLSGAQATVTQATTDQLRYQLVFNAKNTNNFNLSTDLGIPNLDLSFTGAVGLDLELSAVLDFGIDLATNNFFVDTAAGNEVTANLTLQNTQDFAGELGFLSLKTSDRSPTEKAFRSSLGFSLDLVDEPNDADTLLNLSQLNTITSLNPLLTGFLNLNPNLRLGSDSLAYLPKLNADLAFNAKYNFANGKLIDVNNPNVSPTVNFNNVRLDLSAVFGENSIIFGVLSKVYEVIKPVTEVLDALTKNLDFITGDFPALGLKPDEFKEIVNAFLRNKGGGLNNDIFPIFKEEQRITILDLLIVGGSVYERITGKNVGVSSLIDSIPLIKIVAGFSKTLEASKQLGSGQLGFGNFSFNLDNVGVNGISQPSLGTVDPNSSNIKNQLTGFGQGFAFPLIDNPQVVFNYLTGQENFDLFTYDLPTFNFNLNFDDLVNIPIIGPLGFTVGAGIGMQAFAGSPDFGFNSQGLNNNSNSLADIITSGFYLVDKVNGQEKPEVTIEGNISAGVSIAPPGVGSSLIKLGGKVGAEADFDLINGRLDLNKVFLNELQFPFFDIDGKIFAQLNAKVNIKLSTVINILRALQSAQDASNLLLKRYLEGAVEKLGFNPTFVDGALQIVNFITSPITVTRKIARTVTREVGKFIPFLGTVLETVTETVFDVVEETVGFVTKAVAVGSEVLDVLSVELDLNSPEVILWQASLRSGGNEGGNNNAKTEFAYIYADVSAGEESTLDINVGNRVRENIITPPNALPALSTVNKFSTEDNVVVFIVDNFINAFSDANGDSLSKIKILSLPTNGSLRLGNATVTVNQEIAVASLGSLTFIPNANFNGNSSFSWNGFDGKAYANASATVAIAITAVNDLPTISNISKPGNTNSSVNFTAADFTSKFTDADGNSLSKIKIVSLPIGGALRLGNVNVSVNQEISTASLGSLSFVPNSGFGGNTSFAWNGFDGTDYASNWALVNLTYPVIPVITLAVSPSSVTEDGANNLVYTFTRSGPTTNTLTVNYTIGGTATNGTDYASLGTSVIFQPNASTATVIVNPNTDSTVEPDDTVSLALATGTGYTIGTTTPVIGTIQNDDSLPNITLAVNPSSVTEDGLTNLIYTFTRTGPTANALTVNYSVGGTATFSTDYTQTGAASFNTTTGSVTFAPGLAIATVTIDPTPDTDIEPDDTVILTLSTGNAYTVGTLSPVTGTITNVDVILPAISLAVNRSSVVEDGLTNLVYTFTRTGPTANALNVNYSVGGTATFNSDYTQTGAVSFNTTTGTVTFTPGSETVTVTIDPTVDTTIEPDETVILTLATGNGYTVSNLFPVTATITNDDVPAISLAVNPSSVAEDGSNNLVYTFTRTGSTANALTVNYSVGGTATFSTDYTQTGAASFNTRTGTVTFAPGSAIATVTIDPTPDTNIEPNDTVILTLTTGNAYTVSTLSPVAGTITNDDLASPAISIAVNPSSVTEDGPTNLVYTFTRNLITANSLTVNYTISGTAGNGFDYTSIGTSVTFSPGSATATIIVDPIRDFDNEPNETITVTISPGSGYTLGSPASATGTILNGPPTSGNDSIVGTDFEDLINALAGNDTILGRGGNDELYGNAGDDSILGESGNDDLYGESGNDVIYGGSGNDYIDGGEFNGGNDFLYGENGDDIILGGDGNDFLNAGSGNDFLYGESGNDVIYGGDGNDIIYGGAGDDTIYGGGGIDTIYGGGGSDTIFEGELVDFGGPDFPSSLQALETADGMLDDSVSILNTLASVNFNKSANEDNLITFTAADFSINFANTYSQNLTKIKITELPNVSAGSLQRITPDIIFNIDLNEEIALADLNQLVFVPNDNFNGNASFSWTGFNGTAFVSTPATVSLNITPVADRPTLTDVNKYGSASVVTFTANDFIQKFNDADGDPLTKIKITSLPANGTLKLGNTNVALNQEIPVASLNTLTFTPNAGFNDSTSFSWNGFDGTNYAFIDANVNLTLNNPGNSLNTAYNIGQLLETKRYTNSIGQAGSSDYYRLEMLDFGLLTILLEDLSSNVDLQLLSVSGEVLQSSTQTATQSERIDFPVDPGVYFIQVLQVDAVNTEYTLRLTPNIDEVVRIVHLDDGIDGEVIAVLKPTFPGEITEFSQEFSGIKKISADGGKGNDILELEPGVKSPAELLGGDGNDQLQGGDGNDSLSGGLGDDTLTGGLGADTLNGGNGVDKVDYSDSNAAVIINLASQTASGGHAQGDRLIEVEDLEGSDFNDNLTGNNADNLLLGGTGNDTLNGGVGNDILVGGLGNDSMSGGTGNDTYLVDALGDAVIETSTLSSEIDDVQSIVDYTLPANVENLLLNGNVAIRGTGNALNNTIIGNNLNNILEGGAGNDLLIGDLGDDTLSGGTSNDTYLVDALGDVVVETSSLATELDTVQSSVNFTLGANLEDLLLTDSAVNGLGNSLNNLILGNAVNNTLIGNAGSDTLFGDLGNDILIPVNSTSLSPGANEIDLVGGGLGADRFILGDAGWFGYDDGTFGDGSNDYADIADFEPNEGDTIQLKGRSSNYLLQALGSDTRLLLDKPGNELDELIAIIRGKNNLNLNSNYFTYILGQEVPSTFQVLNFQSIASGFTLQLSNSLNTSVLNLYDGADESNDLPDLTLVGATSGPVQGSLVWQETTKTLTFVKTGGILAVDNYTLTLASRSDGIVSINGNSLDGNGDGTAEDNYTRLFSVSNTAARVLSIPDFSRGPGQSIDVPAGDSLIGLPIRLDNPSGATGIEFTLQYNPDLLTVTGVSLAANLPTGWQVTSNLNTLGQATFSVFGTNALAGTALTDLMYLTAQMKSTATYGETGVLNIVNPSINQGNIASVGDSAVVLAALFGDATGNRGYSGLDASRIARIGVGLDSGFDPFPFTDPVIVGDITGNNAISGLDASRVAQKAVGIAVPAIP